GVRSNDTISNPEITTAEVATQPTHGNLAFNPDGSFTYTPTGNFAGTDSFTYKLKSGSDTSAAVAVTLTLTPVPTAANDTYYVAQDHELTVPEASGVLDNDTGVDGGTPTAVVVSNPNHGTLDLNPDGSFTYTPDSGFDGPDSFTYKAHQTIGDSTPATVTINVVQVVDGLAAVPDGYATDENQLLTVAAADGVLKNDAHGVGTTLTASLVANGAHGVAAMNLDGSFTYTPNSDFSGSDTFTYQASDGAHTATAVVTVTVKAINQAPTAADDSYIANDGETLTVTAANGVFKNDFDADQNTLTTALQVDAQHGTLLLNSDGSFTYTPDEGFSGTDTFTYKANDGTVLSNTAA